MTNNDLLIRLRYALDIKNADMVEIFKLGGVKVTKEDVMNMLQKVVDEENKPEGYISVDNKKFDSFLNGFITFRRGPSDKQVVPSKESPNNLLLKKVKIALSLTGDDMMDVFKAAGFKISKGELGAVLRNPDHRNYKECGDMFARNFLKGLTVIYRS